MEEAVTVWLTRDEQARLATIAACIGVSIEEAARMLIQTAIDEGIDRMILGAADDGDG